MILRPKSKKKDGKFWIKLRTRTISNLAPLSLSTSSLPVGATLAVARCYGNPEKLKYLVIPDLPRGKAGLSGPPVPEGVNLYK